MTLNWVPYPTYESWKGPLGTYVVCDGGPEPYSLRFGITRSGGGGLAVTAVQGEADARAKRPFTPRLFLLPAPHAPSRLRKQRHPLVRASSTHASKSLPSAHPKVGYRS